MPSIVPRVHASRKPDFPDWTISIAQIICYVFFSIPIRLWYKPRRHLSKNLSSLKRGALIISNHQSKIDPFFVLASMPFLAFLSILPIRFPTHDSFFYSFFYNPRFFPVLSLLGCIPVGTTSAERMKVIFYIRKLLQQKKTVFLFPEGEIIKEKNVKQLKQGIDFFIKDASMVMFVRFHGLNKTFREGVSRRISFGEVFEPPPSMTVDGMRAYLEDL